MAIEDIIKLLEQEYGAREWRCEGDPVDVLIQTLLSQNTSDVNSGRAFRSLKGSFDSWQAVASAPVDEIARAIRSGGLFRIKALRIKQLLEQIEKDRGTIDLGFLGHGTPAEAERYLMRLPGIGYKTARCVLLFSLGTASLPVDTHIFRVARRLGLIASGASVEQAHILLQSLVPPSEIYQFHVHVIEHGRRVCRARRPLCNGCVLKGVCRWSSE